MYTIIWLHGLGADSNDMQMLAQALQLPAQQFQHHCLQAPDRPVTINGGMMMPAWYDIKGLSIQDKQDEPGILASEKTLINKIETIVAAGTPCNQIFLAGFSQGGAMSLFAGLRYPDELAGIIALSAYLPLNNKITSETISHPRTPIFMASGAEDEIVPPALSEGSHAYLTQVGMSNITFQKYPMAHTIIPQELGDLHHWINYIIR